MLFASIYVPSYARQEATAKEIWEKYWLILLLVLAMHVAVFSLLSIKRPNKSELNDELQISLSNPLVIPKSFIEKMVPPQSEEKQSAASFKAESMKPATQTLPIQAPQNTDNTPVVKFNEEIIKPIQTIKPIKVEPIQEKPAPVIELQKPEDKKIQLQSEVQQPISVKPVEPKQAEPKPTEMIFTKLA